MKPNVALLKIVLMLMMDLHMSACKQKIVMNEFITCMHVCYADRKGYLNL